MPMRFSSEELGGAEVRLDEQGVLSIETLWRVDHRVTRAEHVYADILALSAFLVLQSDLFSFLSFARVECKSTDLASTL